MWLSLCSDNHSVRAKKLKVLCRFLLQEPGPSTLWVSFSLQNMSLLLLVQWSMHVTSSVEIQEWKPTVKASTSIPQRLSWELNPATLITTWPARGCSGGNFQCTNKTRTHLHLPLFWPKPQLYPRVSLWIRWTCADVLQNNFPDGRAPRIVTYFKNFTMMKGSISFRE